MMDSHHMYYKKKISMIPPFDGVITPLLIVLNIAKYDPENERKAQKEKFRNISARDMSKNFLTTIIV